MLNRLHRAKRTITRHNSTSFDVLKSLNLIEPNTAQDPNARTLFVTELQSLGILEWQIEDKWRDSFNQNRDVSGKLLFEIKDLLTCGLLHSSATKVLEAMTRWANASAKDRLGLDHLVYILGYHYDNVADKEDIMCSIKHVADVRGNIAFRGLPWKACSKVA
jgi:hypothetical protein